jgi:transcriptional regulator with XRE-family HTH domain
MRKQRDTLGAFLREARARQGLTLRNVAARLGITPSYLSDIENDRRTPALRVLENLARILQLDLDELLSRAGRLDEDTEDYLRRSPAALKLLRTVARLELDDSQLEELAAAAEAMAGRRGRR